MDELPSTYRMWIYSLDPTCADIRIQFDKLPEGVDVRGRLVGPRCPGVSTVEVAYPLRPLTELGSYRVVIPEPNLWTPEHPCHYEGPAEFWRGGELVGKVAMSIGVCTPAKRVAEA